MPSARPAIPAPHIGHRIGGSIKSTRIAFGWTEREFAERLGTNQAAIQRLEGGQAHLDVRLATGALDALGIRLTIDANPIGLAGRRDQRDLVHARCSGYVVHQLSRRGWDVRTEVEIGEGRFRGWIDILAYRPDDGAVLVIEIKTEIDDFGRVLRSLHWYVRSSREAASRFGWTPRLFVPALLALATIETDARIAANVDLIRSELPGGATALGAWIEDSTLAAPPASVALVDPASRRAAWLWRTRSDGRRSIPRYRDYRDAAARLGGRGRDGVGGIR